jgi:hypothetical protein
MEDMVQNDTAGYIHVYIPPDDQTDMVTHIPHKYFLPENHKDVFLDLKIHVY